MRQTVRSTATFLLDLSCKKREFFQSLTCNNCLALNCSGEDKKINNCEVRNESRDVTSTIAFHATVSVSS